MAVSYAAGEEHVVSLQDMQAVAAKSQTNDSKAPSEVSHDHVKAFQCSTSKRKELENIATPAKKTAKTSCDQGEDLTKDDEVSTSKRIAAVGATLGVELIVHATNGDVLTTISAAGSWTGADVKAALQGNIPNGCGIHSLLFDGVIFRDDQTVQSIGLSGVSVLHAVFIRPPTLHLFKPCSAIALSRRHLNWNCGFGSDDEGDSDDWTPGGSDCASEAAKAGSNCDGEGGDGNDGEVCIKESRSTEAVKCQSDERTAVSSGWNLTGDEFVRNGLCVKGVQHQGMDTATPEAYKVAKELQATLGTKTLVLAAGRNSWAGSEVVVISGQRAEAIEKQNIDEGKRRKDKSARRWILNSNKCKDGKASARAGNKMTEDPHVLKATICRALGLARFGYNESYGEYMKGLGHSIFDIWSEFQVIQASWSTDVIGEEMQHEELAIRVTEILATRLTNHFKFCTRREDPVACAPIIYGGVSADGSIVGVITGQDTFA